MVLRRPRVLFVCGAKPDYIRNESLLAALRRHADVIQISSGFGSYLFRLPIVITRLLLERQAFDVLVVGFLAQPIVPFARLRRGKPLVVDMFISVYETLCYDRRVVRPRSLVGRVSRWLDEFSCSQADKVLAATPLDAEFLSETFGVCREDVVPLYLSPNEEIFHPRGSKPPSDHFRVLYYCSYLPPQGADVVVRASKLLEEEGVVFRVIGKGIERPRVDKLAAQLGLRNCEFIDWVAHDKLPREIEAADVCLAGHFAADNDKARRAIPGRAFELLAMAKPTVLGDSPATREVFEHGNGVYLVRMGDPQALANAIRELRDNPELRKMLGERGRQVYTTRFANDMLADEVRALLAQITPLK